MENTLTHEPKDANTNMNAAKQEPRDPEYQVPGLWHIPSTSTNTLSENTLFRTSSCDSHTDKPPDINEHELPDSTSTPWDFAIAGDTPPSSSTTPSPRARSPSRDENSNSNPRGTKVRRPESESHCFRKISIFSPTSALQDDKQDDYDDLGDGIVQSRIKPPDPTPADESEDEDGGAIYQGVRRTSSAPTGRVKQ